jgi:DAK2 domain fusion protein YloV
LVAVLESARSAAADALARTPDMLEVLARAGVVDAGGTGYLLMMDALLNVADGRPVPEPAVGADGPDVGNRTGVARGRPFTVERGPDAGSHGGGNPDGHVHELRYEVMYLLHAPDDAIDAFREVWAGLGDSIVVVGGDGLWQCHIHTDEIGPAIEAALDAGRPTAIRVTDLQEQVEEERWVRESVGAVGVPGQPVGPPPRTGVVAVVTGDGIGRIFRSLGVHGLVHGGQSANPSTADILDAVEALGSEGVVVLPNNPNIRAVAEQVDGLTSVSVRVVPTGSIVEGFAALLAYDPASGPSDNERAMTESARRVAPGEVTIAVRDAQTEVGPVRAGDWIGVSRDGVVSVGTTVVGAACKLLEHLMNEDHELVTLIEGEGATGADTRRLTEWIHDEHPDLAVEVHHGGQPLYPYLLGIE